MLFLIELDASRDLSLLAVLAVLIEHISSRGSFPLAGTVQVIVTTAG